MLPPVRTISGSSGSYQNSSSVTASAHLTGEPIFPGQTADADRDVNPNLAGKLNVLLLSGRDLVPEDLSMLADALGRAIDVPRRPGEVSAAYVHRLADALSHLSGTVRAEAERQLNLILRGVRLSLVIEAFLNPAGPEAARVVALIEMAGLKDRDLATRTVLTSYRQNGGADIPLDPPMQGPPRSNGLAPFAPSASLLAGAAAGQASGDAQMQGPAPAVAGEATEGMPLIMAEEFEDEPELVIFHAETDNIFSRTSSEPLKTAFAPEPDGNRVTGRPLPAAGPSVTRQGTAAAVTDRTAPITDARRLQTLLDEAFAAGDNADPVIQAKAAIELLANDEPSPLPSFAGRRPPLPREDMLPKPFIDYTRPPPRPAVKADMIPVALALEGWTESDVLGLPLLPASVEAEAMLNAALTPHAGPEPDMPEGLFHLRGRGIAANDDRHRSALAAAEQQLLRTADEAAGLAADRRLDMPPTIHPAAATERSGADALIAAALQLGHDPRTPTGYASHPYPVVDERDEGPGDRAGYRSQSDKEEDEEAGEGGDAESGAPEMESEPEGLAAADAGERLETSDPAYDYYQRMGGWN